VTRGHKTYKERNKQNTQLTTMLAEIFIH